MEILVKSGDNVTWRGQERMFLSVEQADENAVHVNFEDGKIYFVSGDTEINGKVCNSVEEIMNELNK